MTNILLGDIQLDDVDFEWPLYTGGFIRPASIAFDAERAQEFEALPYITTLKIECSGEDGTTDPAMETLLVEGVRVLEVRVINDVAGVVYLADFRADLARRVFPADFLLRWKDGYLTGTNHPSFRQAIEYAAEFLPELADALAPEAFAEIPDGEEFNLPDGIIKAGMLALPAIEALASLVGSTISGGSDGKMYFPAPGGEQPFATEAYSWLGDMLPSWDVRSRRKRGLPKTYRVYYNERHSIRASVLDERSTSTGGALSVFLEQVYAFDDRHGTLSELLTHFGFSSRAITHEQIARLLTAEQFEGTDLELDGSTETEDITKIIKRDFRTLYRLVYGDNLGRIGGWTEMVAGRFTERRDKDGELRYSEDAEAASARAEWTQWFDALLTAQRGEQARVEGAVAARSYKTTPFGEIPKAPFDVAFDEATGLIRLSFNRTVENTAAAFIGTMVDDPYSPGSLIVKTGDTMLDDDGNTVESEFGLFFPEISDLQFKLRYDLEIFFIGTRRLPNTQARWTFIDVPGFEDGDVEMAELEVGDELHALRDYVDPAARQPLKPAEADGFGPVLNMAELQRDAERRVRIVKEDMAARLEGEGVAQGIAPVADLVYPHGPVAAMDIIVDDSTVVTTRITMANRDSAQSRHERKRKREFSRRREAGGVPLV